MNRRRIKVRLSLEEGKIVCLVEEQYFKIVKLSNGAGGKKHITISEIIGERLGLPVMLTLNELDVVCPP